MCHPEVVEESFRDRYGPWAVVTGAAQGVGLAFTETLVSRGLKVVMVDRSPELPQVADRFGDDAHAVVADLIEPGWLAMLDDVCGDLDVGLAVANAGISPIGRLVDTDASALRATIDLNCGAVTDLSAWALPRLIERGRGGLVLMSSGSALAGTAGLAVYSATKAFAVNLAEALAVEAGPSGVDVQAVLGPSMDTPAFRASAADLDAVPVPPVDPATVVTRALDALADPESDTAWMADDGLVFLATLPRSQRVEIMAEVTAAMYPRIAGGS